MSGVPYTFATASGSIPLNELDSNFATPITLGSSTVSLGGSLTTIAGLTLTSSAINGTVGATTPSTGAFTNLSASGTITGTAFSLYFASPPSIGSSAANSGAFTTLSASSTVSGAGFTNYLASPPAIGTTAAAAGAFTTLSASSTVSGPGFSAYLASPPAIGSSTPSTGAFTTISAVGTTSAIALKTPNITEPVNVVGTAPSSTQNFYIASGAVQYYTSNAANNWTVNFAFSSGTSLNAQMSIGDSITATMLVTQGTTAYFCSAVTIDGVSVTPLWQGGTAPSSGNASGVDAYVFAIIKTASATYSVFASQTKF